MAASSDEHVALGSSCPRRSAFPGLAKVPYSCKVPVYLVSGKTLMEADIDETTTALDVRDQIIAQPPHWPWKKLNIVVGKSILADNARIPPEVMEGEETVTVVLVEAPPFECRGSESAAGKLSGQLVRRLQGDAAYETAVIAKGIAGKMGLEMGVEAAGHKFLCKGGCLHIDGIRQSAHARWKDLSNESLEETDVVRLVVRRNGALYVYVNNVLQAEWHLGIPADAEVTTLINIHPPCKSALLRVPDHDDS